MSAEATTIGPSQATNLVSALRKDGVCIEVRQRDGYVNATKMAKSGGKQWKHYHANEDSRNFLGVLAEAVGKSTASLVDWTDNKGPKALWGTWVASTGSHRSCSVD